MAGHVGPGVTVGEQEGQGPQKVFATKTHLGSSLGAQGEEPRAHAGDAPPGAMPGPLAGHSWGRSLISSSGEG